MCKLFSSKILFFISIFVFSVQASLACMYGPPYRTVCETYAQADSVIIGKIESVKGDNSNQTVVINIEKTFKGQNQKRIVLSQPQSTCDWDFSSMKAKLYCCIWFATEKRKNIAPLPKVWADELKGKAKICIG